MHSNAHGFGTSMLGVALFASLLAASSAPAAVPAFSGGDGSADNPYRIANEADLVALRVSVTNGTDYAGETYAGKHFKLMQDVVLSATTVWAGIGKQWEVSKVKHYSPFSGTFDGNGKTISNVRFGLTTYQGFFNLLSGATISNLTIAVVGFASNPGSSECGAGVFCGYAYGTRFENCVAKGQLPDARHNASGFAVEAAQGTAFVSCTNDVSITSAVNKRVAGFVCFDLNLTGLVAFTNCVNNGNLEGRFNTSDYTANHYYANGGFVGSGGDCSYIFRNCVNKGTVRTDDPANRGAGTFFGSFKRGGTSAAVSIVAEGCRASNGQVSIEAQAGFRAGTDSITGLSFAEKDGKDAVFCVPEDGRTYKVMTSVAAAYPLKTAASTITLDESLTNANVTVSAAAPSPFEYAPKATPNPDGTTTYSVGYAEFALNVTPASTASYSATDAGDAVVFAADSAAVRKGAQVVVTAVAKDAAHAYRGAAPAGWVKVDDTTVTYTYTVAADRDLAIPGPTALKTLEVEEKGSYTNIQFTISSPTAGACTITAKDKEGNTVGSVDRTLVAGDTVLEVGVTEFGNAFRVGEIYTYEVTKASATVGKVTYANVGWVTNVYFAADATGPAYVNGAWAGTAPAVADNAFRIEGLDNVFSVTNETVKRDETHQIVDLVFKTDFDNYYLLEDVTNDVKGAVGGLALVSNETAKSVYWVALKDGTNWVEAACADSELKKIATYDLRFELDYHAKPAMIRYSVKKGADAEWTPLTIAGAEWVDTTNDTLTVSNVCFAGKADVAKFDARLSTKAVAEAGGVEYADILDAMAHATAAEPFVLYANIRIDPRSVAAGNYAYDGNGKTFAVVPYGWRYSDGQGRLISVSDGSITAENKTFVATIGKDDADRPAYWQLTDALADGADTNVFLVASAAQNAVSDRSNVTLDLNGKVLTPTEASEPIIKVTGGALTLVDTAEGTKGKVTGATTSPALEANGGTAVVAGAEISGNEKAVLATGSASQVDITSGWFDGKITSADGGAIDVTGGYFKWVTFAGERIAARGGRFTQAAATAPWIQADGYLFADFGVPPVVRDVTFSSEVVKKITSDGETVPSKVWVANDGSGEPEGTVQLPDSFVEAATDGKTGTAAQDDLNAESAYSGKGAKKMKKWHCYVLGMESAATTETDHGPYVQGVPNTAPGKIGFSFATAAMVKAAEAGCKVEYEVLECATDGTPTGVKSDKVDYTENAEIDLPAAGGGTRFYKMKVYITPKK